MTKRLRLIGCLLLASLFCSLTAYGQTDTASIVGTVVDASGAALPNAVVTLMNLGTNLKTVAKTDSAGNYIATPLKIGNYSVAVEVQGFKGVTRTGIVLQVQDRLRVDFALQVGSVSEQITVRDAAPLLQSESSALGNVIESQQIADLPLALATSSRDDHSRSSEDLATSWIVEIRATTLFRSKWKNE